MNKILQNLDFTTIFKDKKFGDLKRWSAKRTIGGAIVLYSINTMGNTFCWEGIALCLIGVLPLCLSMFEGGKCDKKCKY
jgi:hypothetical protein|tara:strand:- start:290 stop:526 length:237 start_codon:yes stop_codon:yes gene_type:complete